MNHATESTDLSGEIHICKNCSNQFEGKFCNLCGEKVISQHDRTIGHFLGELFHVLTHADGKIWKNLKLMITSPGTVSKNYAYGWRKPFLQPMSMFFVANLIYFLFPLFETFSTSLHSQVYSHPYRPLIENRVNKKMEKDHLTFAELGEKYNKETKVVSKLILIVVVPFFALVYALLHLRGPRLFADHILMGLEFMTYTLVYNTIVFSILVQIIVIIGAKGLGLNVSWLSNEQNFILPVVAVSMIYFSYRSERTFYQQKILWAILKTAAFIFLMPYVLYLYRFILFHITMSMI